MSQPGVAHSIFTFTVLKSTVWLLPRSCDCSEVTRCGWQDVIIQLLPPLPRSNWCWICEALHRCISHFSICYFVILDWRKSVGLFLWTDIAVEMFCMFLSFFSSIIIVEQIPAIFTGDIFHPSIFTLLLSIFSLKMLLLSLLTVLSFTVICSPSIHLVRPVQWNAWYFMETFFTSSCTS